MVECHVYKWGHCDLELKVWGQISSFLSVVCCPVPKFVVSFYLSDVCFRMWWSLTYQNKVTVQHAHSVFHLMIHVPYLHKFEGTWNFFRVQLYPQRFLLGVQSYWGIENGTCAIASIISLLILLSNKTLCVYQVAIFQELLKIVCLYRMEIPHGVS